MATERLFAPLDVGRQGRPFDPSQLSGLITNSLTLPSQVPTVG